MGEDLGNVSADLYSYGLYSYGLYTHGLHSSGQYSDGRNENLWARDLGDVADHRGSEPPSGESIGRVDCSYLRMLRVLKNRRVDLFCAYIVMAYIGMA